MNDSVTLKEHIESRLISIEKATELALAALNERLAGMNEFRAALNDVLKLLATKAELGRLEEDVRVLRESRAILEGKASQNSVNQATLIAIIGIILGSAGLIIAIVK